MDNTAVMDADFAQLVALLAAGTLSIVVFTALLGRREAPGATPFLVVALGVAIWALASALTLIQESDRAAGFWFDVSLVGSTMLATSWLAMALQYTGRGSLLTRRTIPLLMVEPVVFLLLAFRTDARNGYEMADNLLFGINNTYAYTLLAVGLFLFVRAFQRGHRLYSAQAASVVIAIGLPGASNLLAVLDVWPSEFDPTPVAVAVGAAVLVWGLFKARLFDVIPVARALVMETMSDGVIVSDGQGRVVDINAAGAAIVRRASSTLLGLPLDVVLQLAGYRGNGAGFTQAVDGSTRYYELTHQPLRDGSGGEQGDVCVIHDVTASRMAERRCGRRWRSSTRRWASARRLWLRNASAWR